MKKLLSILAILAFTVSLSACCKGMVNGVETKSFSNCLAKTQPYVCNPSPAVIATANAIIPILLNIKDTFIPGTAAFNAYVTAENILTVACVTVTDLQALINFFQAQKMAKAGVKGINLQPLIDWSKTAAKK